ncbi:MAG TPA: hypothetical protein VL860_00455 [Planctomycetota bacterium]|nr:hypothetical protein [Planctomycetota bacterium]
MKKPGGHDPLSFKPTQRCSECGCWLRSGNHTGRCALHAGAPDHRNPKASPAPASHVEDPTEPHDSAEGAATTVPPPEATPHE